MSDDDLSGLAPNGELIRKRNQRRRKFIDPDSVRAYEAMLDRVGDHPPLGMQEVLPNKKPD